MREVILLSVFVTFYSLNESFEIRKDNPDKVSIEAVLLTPVKAEEILIRVQVKNLSPIPMLVPKYVQVDYKWERIRSLGNFIIEFQKLAGNKFRLFPPSADIDPQPGGQEQYIRYNKGEIIMQTLSVPGSSFSRGGSHGKFPPGDYRVRVSFNSDQWSSSQKNSSKWLYFYIN